ncbi:hypothetical protein OROHE_023068 [Orobanche hederae]
MLSTSITSTISLRSRGSSLPFLTNDCSHCPIETHPFFYSSSRSCCCCLCSNQMYKVPVTPNHCYNLYGLKQSSLIQWSLYTRLIRGGLDRRYYTGLPACDVGGECYCDRLCSYSEKSVGRREGGLRRCMLFDEMSERYDVGGINEAEAVLSLLTEDIDEECFRAKKETRRLVKKPVVEKRGNKFECRKKRIDQGVVESESQKCEKKSIGNLSKKDNTKRDEIIWRQEMKEALLREENQKKERKDALKNRSARGEEEEEVEALLRKPSQKAVEEQEKESMLRKENSKLRSRTEEREDLLRRENQRQETRRDGSSCSSYYSFSSTGEYESENENELREGRSLGGSTSNHIRNSSIEIVDQNAREEYQRHEAYIEDHKKSLTKNTEKELYGGSIAIESDFRKKSEKKLTDISVEEMETSKKSPLKESDFSSAHKSNYKKVPDRYYDDPKVKSSESTKVDEERKQQLVQTGVDLRQSETRLKYKQFVDTQDTRGDDVRNFYVSQVASHETVGEHQAEVGLGTREGKYERNSHTVSEVSENQEIDIRKTSVSQQRFETSVKQENYSTNRVSGLGKSRGTSQNLTNKNGNSILKSESVKLIKEEDKLNLAYGPSFESKQTCSQTQARIIKRVDSRIESEEFTTHSGNSHAISVENRIKTELETAARPATYHVGNGSTHFDSTAVRGDDEERSLLSRHNISHEQPSKLISQEDAIGSAARLEKSSAHYVGEFVNQLRREISSSEIQREKKSSETKLVHEEQHPEKISSQHSSGDPHSHEHDLKHANQPPGSKGPSDEMWNVDEPSIQKLHEPEIQDNAIKPENSIFKRDGKSLWNIFTDIVRLRWSSQSENHSSHRKTGGKSSPNQSTSSETWFSGHEAEDNEGTGITHGLSARHQEEKTHSLVEEGSSSLTSESCLKNMGMNAPSSSMVLETSQGNLGDTSSASIVVSPITIPALRLRRFSALRGALETGKGNTPESGVSTEQAESMVNEELKRKKLQRKDQVVKDRFDEWEEAYRLEAEQLKIDEMFMREALLEGKKAADNWEVPVGAVLVHNGKIIARGCNLVEEMRDSTAHAEIICIREASNVLRTWRLSETTLYVTLEPCAMCAGAILQARIDTVVWGAPNKLLGADGGWIRLFPSGEGQNNGLERSDEPSPRVHPFHPKIVVRRQVLASECADAMQQFFKLRRKKEKKPETPSTPPPSCLPISHRPFKFFSRLHGAFSLMFCL